MESGYPTTFVSLTEEDELSPIGANLLSYAPAVATQAARTGERATCLRLPVRDLSIPSIDGMRTILGVINLSLEAGRPVYVHCLGGIGRTGTVVGCWLRRHQLATADDVLAVLAELRRAEHRSCPSRVAGDGHPAGHGPRLERVTSQAARLEREPTRISAARSRIPQVANRN